MTITNHQHCVAKRISSTWTRTLKIKKSVKKKYQNVIVQVQHNELP